MRREDKWIRFTEHAIADMYERDISREQVKAVLKHPDQVRRARSRGRLRFEKRVSRRKRLVVIVQETSDTLWVISVFSM